MEQVSYARHFYTAQSTLFPQSQDSQRRTIQVKHFLPTHEALLPIKPASKLMPGLPHLPLQNRELDNPLTIFRADPSKPDTLRRTAIDLFYYVSVGGDTSFGGNSFPPNPFTGSDRPLGSRGINTFAGQRLEAFEGVTAASVHHAISTVLVSADVRNEVYTDPAGTVVVEVAVEAKRAEVSFEFAAEEGRGLAAAGVACLLGTE